MAFRKLCIHQMQGNLFHPLNSACKYRNISVVWCVESDFHDSTLKEDKSAIYDHVTASCSAFTSEIGAEL
jgi:hypothetical protein